MSNDKLQRTVPATIKEKGQYLLAFGVIASMLVVVGFPWLVVFFFGIFAYAILKLFTSGSRSEVREVFEFYLSANEILRDDERKWFGFEINETIERGESIIRRMSGAPPLVYFTLGALYNKSGDHKSAVNYLSHVLEDQSADESAFAYPSQELRSYVKVLRKIEREPAEAPMTSAAVRALERSRRLRGALLLEESRTKFSAVVPVKEEVLEKAAQLHGLRSESVTTEHNGNSSELADNSFEHNNDGTRNGRKNRSGERSADDQYANRKPISEVLHDIYDSRRT
ncbi:MAG: hypothetical protein ACT4O9_04065 [Blastocatellia bacterium]